ncbi:MAG: hypothetical protein M3R08_03175 [Bacteroidota bacterium]|nr:hypothetical protein [Bacteroidota bacterium]
MAKRKLIVVNDSMQKRYQYFLTESAGRDFQPDFLPQLTPQEMLEMGVFGGRYMTDCTSEFPKSWFTKAKLYIGTDPRGDRKLNFFGVQASQPLSVWREKGWIHKQDPRGWFQWYCRYYCGRRSDDDVRQIKRWKAIARHVAQVRKNCRFGDLDCRRKQRQALLHWAYDSINL